MSKQFLNPIQSTVLALRHNGRKATEHADEDVSSLYEHLYGYDPIRVVSNRIDRRKPKADPKDSAAENPRLNIINPLTNYAVMEIASEETPNA